MKITRKAWLWVLMVLLLLNLLLTGFMIIQKNIDHRPGKGLTRLLSLNKEQEQKFERSREAHFKEIEKINEEIRLQKKSLFVQVGKSKPTAVDSILNRLAQLEKNKNINTFNHFSQVRSYLSTIQQEKFDKFLKNTLSQGPNLGGEKGLIGRRLQRIFSEEGHPMPPNEGNFPPEGMPEHKRRNGPPPRK